MRFFLRSSLLLSSVVALPLNGHDSYGHGIKNSDYVHDDGHHTGGFYDSGHAGHENGATNYYSGHKDSAHSASVKASAGDAHKHNVHGQEAGSKYSAANSDFGKGFGSPESEIRPQYHVEQFHSDEKHANKYGSDAHAEGAKDIHGEEFHNGGYEGYDKAQEAYGGQHAGNNGKSTAEGHTFGDYNSGYDNSANGRFGKGYSGDGGEYEQKYEAPRQKPSYGYAPHY